MGALELGGINAELENIGDFLDVVTGLSSEIIPGTSTAPLTFKCSVL